jgi:DNA-binding CsgD family transcriptional regulator
MIRLSPYDLRRFSTALHDLYAIFSLEEFPSRVLTVLSRLVPADLYGYNEVNTMARQLSVTFHPAGVVSGVPEAVSIFTRYMHEHPVLSYVQRTGDGRACKISDFLTQRQFHELGLYREFYRMVGTEHQMAISIPQPPPAVLGLALNRGRGDFSERDRQMLNLLRPHLIQAYRNAGVVTHMQEEATRVARGLEESTVGFIVATKEGRVHMSTTRARRWMEMYCQDACDEGRQLPELVRRWISRQDALSTRDDDVSAPRAPLMLERVGSRLTIRLLTACGAEQHLLLLTEERTAVSPKALTQLKITTRESEVLFWVAQGKTNAETATLLGVRPRTVHKHLEHIYQKLGVETRTAAARQAFEVLRLTRQWLETPDLS